MMTVAELAARITEALLDPNVSLSAVNCMMTEAVSRFAVA